MQSSTPLTKKIPSNARQLSLCAAALILSFSPVPAIAAPIFGLLDASDAPLTGPGVIRGTIPLPKGFLSAYDTFEKGAVIDADGSLRPAQTDVVTRHPDGSVAIIEVSAFMQGTSSQGETLGRYKVTALPAALKKKPEQNKLEDKLGVLTKLEPEVQTFLQKKMMTFLATGPFDEQYVCNVPMVPKENIKTYKHGYVENTVSVACDLKPESGFNINNKKELPQILNIIAFITTSSGSPVIKLDVLFGNTRVTNGAYVGKSYFKDLRLLIPKEYVLVNDVPTPSYKSAPTILDNVAVYDIIKAQADGTDHVLMPLTWHMRKFAITTTAQAPKATAALGLQGQAFAKRAYFDGKETFNWENPYTANYALGEPLPDFSFIGYNTVKTKMNTEWGKVKSSLMSGSITSSATFGKGALGYTQPWGAPYGGMTGGQEIEMIPPASGVLAGSVNLIRWHHYVLGGYLDRHNNVFGTTANGEPWSVDSALVSCTAGGNPTGKAQAAQFSSGSGTPNNTNQDDPFGILASNKYDYHRNAATMPAYEAALGTYQPIDFQHLVRLGSKLYFLIDVTNDAPAKYLLRAVAENIRSAHTMYAKKEGSSCLANAGGLATIYGSLLNHYMYVQEKPGRGVGIGRAEADTIHAVAESYAAGDDTWRNNIRYWLNAASDIITKSQVQCSGFIMARDVPPGKGLEPPFDAPGNRVAQSLESARISQTMEVLHNQVFKGYDENRALKLRATQDRYIKALIDPAYMFGPSMVVKLVHVYNANTDQVTCPNSLQAGMLKDNGNWEMPNDLLRGWARTGNPAYLNTANAIMPDSTLLKDLEKKFTGTTGNTMYWESWASTALDIEQKRLGY